jgi:hypothetical protein
LRRRNQQKYPPIHIFELKVLLRPLLPRQTPSTAKTSEKIIKVHLAATLLNCRLFVHRPGDWPTLGQQAKPFIFF